jgi:ribosomal protein S18 acetylase RimI-like enzyme
MRGIDQEECEAMGHSPKQALRNGFMLSDRCYTALVDGRPEAMFGAVTVSAIDRQCTVWFLGTDEVYRQGRILLSWGPAMLRRCVDSRWLASNLVSSANRKAIALLRRWGFTVEPEEQMVRGVPFRHFWMNRDV